MRKLLVTCECGQTMQVPRSAVGKMGMCPTCGATMRISTGNTRAMPRKGRGDYASGSASTARGPARGPALGQGAVDPPEEAKQRFGEAVDLYYQQRYGEALAIFDSLARQFPGNPNIEQGRRECMEAMRRPSLPPPEKRRILAEAELDEDVVRRVILDKLMNSHSDAVQLQAAELAARLLGILDRNAGRPEVPDAEGDVGAPSEIENETPATGEAEEVSSENESHDAGGEDIDFESTGTDDR